MSLVAADVLTLAEVQSFDPRHPQKSGETDACCPLCGTEKPIDAAHRSLGYNAQTGAYHCHRCHTKGQFKEFWKPLEPRTAQGPNHRRTAALRRISVPPRAAETVTKAPSDETLGQRVGKLVPLVGTPGEAYLLGRGLPLELCHAAKVRFRQDFFGHPAAMFPICDREGSTVAAQGRYTDGFSSPKTRTVGSKKEGVFSTPGALDPAAPFVCFVEAPIDAMTLASCGVPAVALCGSSGLPDWLRSACAFRTVLAAFDNDPEQTNAKGQAIRPGEEAAKQLAEALLGVGSDVRRLRPGGEVSDTKQDWNTILQEKGAAWLRSWLLPRVYPYPVTVHTDPDPALELIGARNDAYASWWPDSLLSMAYEELYKDAFAFALPVEAVALQSPIAGQYHRSDNPNITACVAFAVLKGGIDREGDTWLEIPAGREVSAIIRRLAVWWLDHPARI